jgi:hypothetical protein
MPTIDELHRLMDVVLAKFRTLAPDTSGRTGAEEREEAYFKSFCAAFRALGYMRRTEEPDHKHYPQHWTDVAQILLRSLGDYTELSRAAFTCAALAHGDIPWTDWRIDGSVDSALRRIAGFSPDDLSEIESFAAGLRTAKFDEYISEDLLRRFWKRRNSQIISIVPQIARRLVRP